MSDLLDHHLKGKRVVGFRIYEHSSQLEVDGGYRLNIEALCRYLGAGGKFIVTEDHGHKFGLSAPYDAEAAISGEVLGQEINAVTVQEHSGDIAIRFANGSLEIICRSMAYEIGQLVGPKDIFVVVRHA
jgi:hypothetical protein